jgi:SAM-dependent methyltransferase
MEWWQTFFGREYVAAWTAAGVFDNTDDEVEGIAALLALPAGARILDVPCGFGRIAGPLHARGYRVVGVDASSHQLALARERNPGPEYRQGDMRVPPPDGPFDAVINVFSSFGYFDDGADDLRAARAWHEALRPGGVLVMTTMHRDYLARHFEPASNGGVNEQRDIDWVAGVARTTVRHDDWVGTFRVRMYTVTDLVDLLREAGFAEVEAFGTLEREPVSPDTRLVLRAIR